MADLNKIVSRYEIQADTSGLDRIAAAADKASASTAKLSGAASSLTTSTDKADKSALGVAAQLDRLAKSADPAVKAMATLERYQRLVDAATKQGQPIREEWSRGLATLRTRHEELSRATGEHTASVGLNRVQLLEASHVAKSFADSLVAGASPLRALSLEGGRLAQIFAEGQGGVTGTLKAMGATVAKLATGWVGLGVAVAAGAGVAVAALSRFQSQQDKLALSLNGAGRASGLNLGSLTGIVNQTARSSRLSIGDATSIAAGLTSSGRVSGDILGGILGQVRPYSTATGSTIAESGDALTKAFSDPSKGAEQLNGKLGFLDDKTKLWIDSLENSGDHLAAQRLLLDKVSEATATATDRTWSMTKAFRDLGETADNWLNKIGSRINASGNALLNGDTPEGRLAKLESQLNSAQTQGLGFDFLGQGSRNGGLIRSLQNQIGAARGVVGYQEYGESREAQRQADIQGEQTLSMKAGDVARSLDPNVIKSRELDDRISLLEKALGDPDISGRVAGGGAAISRSLDLARNERSTLDPLARIQQDSALSVQSIQATTGAERTLIEARRAEIETLRSTHDGALAAAKAVETWNDAIANSNKQTQEALRSARDNLQLVGKSPYERDYLQTRFRARDMLKQATESLPPGMSMLSPDDLRMTALDPDISTTARSKALRNAMINGGAASSDALDAAATLSAPGYLYAPSRARTAAAFGGNAAAAARFAPGNIVVPSTARANVAGFVQASDAASYSNNFLEPIRQQNEEIERNEKLLAARTDAIGKSTFAVNKAVAAQDLWNKLQQAGIEKAKLSTDQISQVSSLVDQSSTRAARLQQQQQQFDQIGAASNWFQQTGSSAVGTLGDDFASLFNAHPRDLVSQLKQGDQAKYYAGQLSGNAVKSKIFQAKAGDFLRNLAFQQGIGLIQKGLFGSGQFGSPGYQSGLLGGVFNSALGGIGGLFGGGGAALGAGGIGSDAVAGATGAGGNIFSSLFSGLGHLFGFADGGIMTGAGPLPLRRYAGGGVANTPQLAMFGEGRTPEAYVPLPDGRSIPVAMKDGGAPSNITLGGHTIVVQGSADDKTADLIDQKLAAANKQMIDSLQRNFGAMSAKWQQRNGS